MVSSRISSLKSKSDFRDLVSKGKKVKVAGWMVIDYLVATESKDDPAAKKTIKPGELKYGMSISKKIGIAVTRNKLKRWCREFFRKSVQASELATVEVKLNLRLRENGDFYKNLQHSEFDEALSRAWAQIKKSI